MLFGKIDYINLLPFHIFIKKYISSSQLKASINYKKSYPSKINEDFKYRRISGAFISSVKAFNKNQTNIGIVAQKEVLSVLICEGKNQDDLESSTSNILAKVLNL